MTGLTPGFIKRSDLAWYSSHHHDVTGKDVDYAYSYLFGYSIDLPPGAKTLTLPVNGNIRILAISVADKPGSEARSPTVRCASKSLVSLSGPGRNCCRNARLCPHLFGKQFETQQVEERGAEMGRTRFTGRESLLANNTLNNGTSSHLPDPLHWDLHEFGHCGWQVSRENTLGTVSGSAIGFWSRPMSVRSGSVAGLH